MTGRWASFPFAAGEKDATEQGTQIDTIPSAVDDSAAVSTGHDSQTQNFRGERFQSRKHPIRLGFFFLHEPDFPWLTSCNWQQTLWKSPTAKIIEPLDAS